MTMRDPSEVIAACPFCGGEAELSSDDDNYCWINCRRCGASTDTRRGDYEDCRAELAAAWNRRALPAATPPAGADRLALKLLVAAGFVTQNKANEALQIAHGFAKGPLTPQRASADAKIKPGQLWRDDKDDARVLAVVESDGIEYAALVRTYEGNRPKRPFLFPVKSMLAGDDGWRLIGSGTGVE